MFNLAKPFLLLFFSLLPLLTSGQFAGFSFTNLDKSNGLASNWCHLAFRDSRGFMWFGTQDGLSRYDGVQMKTYRHTAGDPHSLGGNIVKDIVEDRKGRLWIGTNGGGLSCYDPLIDAFNVLSHHTTDTNSLSCETVVSLYLDEADILWMGNYDCGFHAYDIEKGTVKRFVLPAPFNTLQEAFKRNSVIGIIPDFSDRDVLWLAGNNGLYRFNKKNSQITYFPSDFPGAKGIGVFSLFMENPNEIWMGTYGGGVARFEVATGHWQHFFPNPEAWKQQDEKANLVYSVRRKSPDELWVGSQSEGLAVFNIPQKRFTFIQPVPEDPYSFGALEAYNVCPDRENLIWITTRRRGVFLLNPFYEIFKSHTICAPEYEGEAVPLDVTDFAWDPLRKKLYVTARGTQDVFVFNQNFLLESRIQTGFSKSSVGNNTLLVDASHTLWIGRSPQGGQPSLLRYFPDEGILQPFEGGQKDRLLLQQYEILDLIEDSRQNIWLATAYGGLIRIGEDRRTVAQFISPNEAEPGPSRYVTIDQVIESKTGKLWLSTQQLGVFSFDPVSHRFENFAHYFMVGKGLTENRINDLAEDLQGNIWVGTNATGINILNPAQPASSNLTYLQMKDGLPDEHILKMVKDDHGKIWAFTLSGLCVYNIENGGFVTYDERYGLKGIHSWDMGFYAADGKIFIGRTGGFYFFDVDQLLRKKAPPQVVLTDFKIFEESQKLDSSLSYLNKIVLRYDQNFFSIDFAALSFIQPEKNKYAYILEGFNKDWVYPSGGQLSANFTDVPEGTYTFRVIAGNNNGEWNRQGAVLTIVIQPPWYRTWWAYLLYLAIVVGLGYLIYQYQKSRWALETRLMLEQKEAGQLRQLNQIRSRLYTNITHEFRTPLTVILGLAAEIKGNDTFKTLILRNGRQLLHLVNQLLDLSKVNQSSIRLQVAKGEVISFIRYVMESLRFLAENRQIGLDFSTNLAHLQMDFDQERFRQVVFNLVSNAIKFTPHGGQVWVTVEKTLENDRAMLLLRVSDSGIGIDEKDIPYIFDPFFQIDNTVTRHSPGTGIGLSLTNELVRLMNGKISVTSKKGQGSDFLVALPIFDKAGVDEMSMEPDVSQNGLEVAPTNQVVDVLTIAEQEDTKQELPILLIVEDNPDVVVYLTGMLSKNFQLEIAEDGLEGIEKATELVPDIILTDVMMSGTDGLELCDRLKNDERTSHIPIIVLTARAAIEDRVAGLERGADAYLTKPFYREELLAEINKLLGLPERLRQRYAKLAPAAEPHDRNWEIEDAFVKKAIDAVNKNLSNEGFGPDDLAAALYISRSQLHRKLSALTGLSSSYFIRSIRMQKAFELLQSGNNVSETAQAVGYSEPSYFSKLFKQEFGKSPKKVQLP